MNQSYLSTMFRKYANQGLLEYIVKLRVEKAKQLLEETDVTWACFVDYGVKKQEMIRTYNGCINSLARHWRQDYGLPRDRNLGYGSRIIAMAGASRYANYIGIPTALLESSWQQKYTTDTEMYGPVTNAISAEYFGNMALRLAKEYL